MSQNQEVGLDNHSIKILQVKKIIFERDEARKLENFEKEYNVQIFDQKNGPTGWKFADGSSNKLKPGLKIPTNLQPGRDLKRKLKIESEITIDKNIKKKKQENESNSKTKSNIVEKVSAKSVEQLRNSAMLQSLQSNNASLNVIQGVSIVDIILGDGKIVSNGDRLKVNYVGRLKLTNKVFDSSLNKPFVFRLGRGEVIKGWDIGIQGMKVGGKRVLTIPPEKAYGKTGAPPKIPSNASLVFEITLVGVL